MCLYLCHLFTQRVPLKCFAATITLLKSTIIATHCVDNRQKALAQNKAH